MPIHAPKIFGILGVRTPKRDWSSSRPRKAHPWPKPHLHAKFGADRSTGATRARAEEITKKRKKGKERNLQWQTGCSPKPPTLTQRYVILLAGWSSGDSSKFQVSSKLVQRFSRFWGSKFAISYTYRTSRDIYVFWKKEMEGRGTVAKDKIKKSVHCFETIKQLCTTSQKFLAIPLPQHTKYICTVSVHVTWPWPTIIDKIISIVI